ncbi:hypothetical protein EV424DRAFT_1587614 [Suillus variegatus]|nr:hypothetical protein EV424DRAFT_1587614 [Suillus variegatus]
MPTGVRSPSPLRAPLPGSSTDLETRPLLLSSSAQQIRRPLSRRITEIDENEYSEGPAVVTNSYFPSPNSARSADDSSEEEETEGPLEVVENDPFSQSKRFFLRHEVSPGAVEHAPKLNGKQREHIPSTSFFGSLRVDLRPFLYPSKFPWQFKKIDEVAAVLPDRSNSAADKTKTD